LQPPRKINHGVPDKAQGAGCSHSAVKPCNGEWRNFGLQPFGPNGNTAYYVPPGTTVPSRARAVRPASRGPSEKISASTMKNIIRILIMSEMQQISPNGTGCKCSRRKHASRKAAKAQNQGRAFGAVRHFLFASLRLGAFA
jgi:hypothetical protein